MAKAKKGHGKIIALLLVLVLIAGGVVAYLMFFGDKDAKAVMECSVNPNVQFVLDSSDKVIAVNYLNTDAEILLKDVKLEGKKADEAAKLFVEVSTQAGYIQVSTSGTRVDVTISCENEEDYAELKAKVVDKVNEYFDENGIIAGAVASVQENLAEAAQKIGVKASELANKTQAEVLALVKETSKDIEDIALSLRSGLFEFIEDLRNSAAFASMATLEETVASLNEQINNSNLPDSVKDTLKKQLSDAEKTLKDLQAKLDEEIDKKIEELKQLSQEIFEQAKEQLATLKAQVEQAIETHREYFEQNKAAVQAQIDEYRQSLAA